MNTFATNKKILFDKGEGLAKTSVQLLKLKTVEKSANILSTVTSSISLFLFVAMFLFFVNIALGLWVGQWLHSYSLGFLSVAGFYLITSCFCYFFREQWIKKPLQNLLILKLLQNFDLDDQLNPEDYE